MSPLREKLHEVIFEADTPAGKAFDIGLLIAIIASVAAVMLESVPSFRERWGDELFVVEWVLTGLFSIEYLLRLYCVRRPVQYARSFFGVVDLLALLPTYLSLLMPGSQSLAVVRVLRLLRVFRVLKLARFLGEARTLQVALGSSMPKIIVFMISVTLLVVIAGSVMHFVEAGSEGGFDTIPHAVYWAVVTVTTVGYGDIAPETPFGRFLAVVLMITGYAIIAVPTGIVTSHLIQPQREVSTQCCGHCTAEGHRVGATYCWRCGQLLNGGRSTGQSAPGPASNATEQNETT